MKNLTHVFYIAVILLGFYFINENLAVVRERLNNQSVLIANESDTLKLMGDLKRKQDEIDNMKKAFDNFMADYVQLHIYIDVLEQESQSLRDRVVKPNLRSI